MALRGETAPWSHYNRQLMVMGRGETHRGIKRATLHWRGTLRTNRYRKQNQKAGERLSLKSEGGHSQHYVLHNLKQTNPLRAKISNAWAKHFLSACISTVKNKRCTVSVRAAKQDHMVSEGYRQIWSAMLQVPTHSVSSFSCLFVSALMVKWILFIQVISKQKKNKVAYLRCIKKVHIKHNIH